MFVTFTTAIAGGAVLALAVLALTMFLLSRAVRRTVGGLVDESSRLTAAVREGRLDVRAVAAGGSPEFRPVVEGMNEVVEAFLRPVKLSAEYVAVFSRGELPPLITDEYRGDFDEVKRNWNDLIGVVEMRGRDLGSLLSAAAEGKLDARADVARYSGSNAKVIAAVNDLLDVVQRPIHEAARTLERLARQDLTARMEGDFRGEFAKMKDGINGAAGALHQAMERVADAVQQVSGAAQQISSSSQAVASGASEQASSLEETGASLESMASMTKQLAGSAQQASDLATAATGSATEGSGAMEQMTGAMGRIKAAAERTSQIIKDINEIAFQTNLLALNAAVEAARAGEAGRGFAVVAEEVRSLALRSKEAANKTEELIRQSVKEASEGEGTARRVSDRLSAIFASVSQVTEIVSMISAADKELVVGFDQVSGAMSQMNSVTQQNAASSEESSAAAEQLSSQSAELAAMVGAFRLDRGVRARPSADSRLPAQRPTANI